MSTALGLTFAVGCAAVGAVVGLAGALALCWLLRWL